MKLSHSEWAERKQRDLEDERYDQLMQERRKQLQETARKEKAQKQFSEWLLHKESFERGVQLLGELDDERRQDQEKWFEVAVALNAVDCLRGVYKLDGFNGLPADRDPAHDVSKEELKKRRTLESEFYKWSRNIEHGHEFENVPVDKDLAKQFTLNAQEIMSEYAEQMDRRGEYIIPNLKFSIVKVKQAAHDKRNLFNPDKVIYNKIYNRLLKSEYQRAKEEMYSRLDDNSSRYEDLPLDQAEKRALSNMGLAKMAKWVEEDLIQREEIESRRKNDDREYARKVHEGFLRKKSGLMVRVPDAESDDEEEDEQFAMRKRVLYGNNKENSSRTRMDFSTSRKPVSARPIRSKAATNTVELLGSGKQKYIHCTNKKDLDLARETLRKEGHLFKENFKDEDGDALEADYREAKSTMTKKQRLKQKIKEREEKAAETYNNWSTQKEIRSRALDALQHIDKPGKSGEGTATDEAHWRFVGEQLKSVDQTLLGAFSEWSKGFKTAGQCKTIWEALPPNTCDTCCPSSAVHNVLLKFLNRPGMNFADVFEYAIVRQLRRNMKSDGRRLDEATPEERQILEESLQLDQKSFRKMMKDAGVILQPNEVRILTTLFDEDGDGKISRKEFLRFTGYDPRPGARGEAQLVLRGGKMCCWEACCHVTGMTNAYDVRPAATGDGEHDDEEEDYYSSQDGTATEDDDSPEVPKTQPLLLRSGRKKKGWVRVPLPDLEKRMRKLIRTGDRYPKDFKVPPPSSCELSNWSNEERTRGLDGLEQLAARNREITKTLEIQNQGEAPLAPLLFLGSVNTLPESERQTSLVLKWKPANGSMFPSFYVLEYAGKEGSKNHRNHEFKEIFRDPPSATSGKKQLGTFALKDLIPGVRYFFRLRAFNGYGSSPYTYESFVTAPEAPPQPIVQNINQNTVSISWDSVKAGQQNLLRDLRDVFRSVDGSGKGVVDKEDFLNLLEREQPRLIEALESTPSPNIPRGTLLDTIETSPNDKLSWKDLKAWLASAEEANIVSRKNLLLERPKSSGGDRRPSTPGAATRGFQYILCKCVSDEEVNYKVEGALKTGRQAEDVICSVLKGSEWFVQRAVSDGELVSGPMERFDLPDLRFVELPESASLAKEKPALRVVLSKTNANASKRRKLVTEEQLPSIGNLAEPVYHLEVYEQVYVGSDTSCTLSGLEPGKAYQFRVFVVNSPAKDVGAGVTTPKNTGRAVASRMSRSIIVHMPAVAPPPPKIIGDVSADGVSLAWGKPDLEKLKRKSKAKESLNVKRDDWTKVVGEWAQDPSMETTGGVSDATIRKLFMRYDKDVSGTIDREELTELLSDLGINAEGASFDDALRALDTNGDGTISYPEFSEWYKRTGMQFLLLHRTVKEVVKDNKNVKLIRAPWKVVYRGEKPEAKVTGLAPNMRHSFALQCELNRHVSAPSQELLVFTAPEVPQQPVIIEAGAKHFRIKWYPGHGGADRYILESLLVERLPDEYSARKPIKANKASSETWKQVYEGKESMVYLGNVDPSTVYRFRVRALNQDRISSSPSLISQFATGSSKTNIDKLASKANATKFFEIECTGNVVVGDTILFTERVFSRDSETTSSVKRKTKQPSKTTISSLSQQSMSTLGKDDLKKGTFICERTVAARVVNSVISPTKPRVLVMEVLWSSLSSKTAPTSFQLLTGARITRKETEIFKFETFRAPWAQEDSRWSYDEELDANEA